MRQTVDFAAFPDLVVICLGMRVNPRPVGFGQFASLQPPRGTMFSARNRAKRAGQAATPVVNEADL